MQTKSIILSMFLIGVFLAVPVSRAESTHTGTLFADRSHSGPNYDRTFQEIDKKKWERMKQKRHNQGTHHDHPHHSHPHQNQQGQDGDPADQMNLMGDH